MRRRHKDSYGADTPASLTKATRILKQVDVYPKLHKEFRVQTQTGATVSIVTAAIMLILFLSETYYYLRVVPVEHMVVDTTINEKLRIDFNISFHQINCKAAHVNAMDVAGDLQIHLHNAAHKLRLSPLGVPIVDDEAGGSSSTTQEAQVGKDYCGSCLDATREDGGKCCNTCDELKNAFVYSRMALDVVIKSEQCIREQSAAESNAVEGEGCRLSGSLKVNRVSGNIHVALGETFERDGKLVHQFQPGAQLTYNSSHTIHSLSFGDPYPGMVNSLDETTGSSDQVGAVFQYYIKIIPTVYRDENNEEIVTNQHSYTKQVRHMDVHGPMNALPGAFFVYDISAFMMKLETKEVPFTHFASKICAIIGGMLSIARFIDSYLYHSKGKRRPSKA